MRRQPPTSSSGYLGANNKLSNYRGAYILSKERGLIRNVNKMLLTRKYTDLKLEQWYVRSTPRLFWNAEEMETGWKNRVLTNIPSGLNHQQAVMPEGRWRGKRWWWHDVMMIQPVSSHHITKRIVCAHPQWSPNTFKNNPPRSSRVIMRVRDFPVSFRW
jgi:hypothetical protein